MLSVIKNRSIAFKLAFFILIGCIVIFAVIFSYSYNVSRKLLIEKIENSARSLISGTVSKIEAKILPAEKVPEYLSIAMSNPEIGKNDIEKLLRSVLEKNPQIYGSAVAFEPHAFQADLYYYSPYMYKNGTAIKSTNLGNDAYNYFMWDWYSEPKKLNAPVWSEPYYDTGGGETLMVTYSVPFYRWIDGKQKFTGIVTADLSLAWLEEMVASLKIEKSGYGFLISREGKLITHPDESLVMDDTVMANEDISRKDYLLGVGNKMMKGEIGFMPAKDAKTGKRIWVAYAPVPATGWSLAAVFPKGELMEDLHNLNKIVVAVGITGLVFLIGVIILFANSITKPLKLLASKTRDIAKGDLTFELPGYDAKDEIGDLTQAFSSMKTELVDYIERLTKTTQQKEKIESELKIATSIQMGTLPKIEPPFTGRDEFELYAMMKPAREVGGDFYDFFFIDDKHLAFVIGDVSGKGVPAAIFAAVAKTSIQSTAKIIKEPVDIMRMVNAELAHNDVAAMFVTVFFGILDIKTGEISYANAGHNSPLVIRKGADPDFFEGERGGVLGSFDDMPMGGGKLQMDPGDVLFMYTDGVTEAETVTKEQFSDERLKVGLTECNDTSLEKIAGCVLSRIEGFVGGASQSDDITILAVKYLGHNN